MISEETMTQAVELEQRVEGTVQQFAANLRMLRAYRNLSQQVVAARAGVSGRTLQDYEQGRGNPSLRNIAALALALSTDARFLLTRVKIPGPEEAPETKEEEA